MTEPPYQPENPPPAPPMPYAGQAPLPVTPRNGLGIGALVLAIVGLLLCWTVAGGVIFGVVAVIMGLVARGRVKRGEANNGGVALAGVVLGFLSILAGLVFIAIWVIFWNGIFGVTVNEYVDCMNKAGQDSSARQQCIDQFRQHLEPSSALPLTTAP